MRLAPKAHQVTELKRRTGIKMLPRLVSNSQSKLYSPQSLMGLSPRSELHTLGARMPETVLLYPFEYSSRDEPERLGYEWAYVLQGR
jgi:hypothetical protein